MDTDKNLEVDDPPKSLLQGLTPSERMEQESISPAKFIECQLLESEEDGASKSTSRHELEETEQVLPLKDSKKRLGGAAKKRFKWLLRNGHNPEEAHLLALKPYREEKGHKRPRLTGSTPENIEAKRNKVAPVGPTDNQPSTSNTTQPMRQGLQVEKIGVLHANYPEELLTIDQLKAVQDLILKKILELKEGTSKPKFLGSTFKAGWLLLNCKDKATTEWLKAVAEELKPWEGAKLRIVEEGDIPKSQIIIGYFPNSNADSSDDILGFIQGQNEGLNVNNWKVLRRAPEGSVLQITFSVDNKSVQKLKALSFRVSSKFGQVKLRPKSSAHKAPKHEADTKPSAIVSTTILPNMAERPLSKTSYSSKGKMSATMRMKYPEMRPAHSGNKGIFEKPYSQFPPGAK